MPRLWRGAVRCFPREEFALALCDRRVACTFTRNNTSLVDKRAAHARQRALQAPPSLPRIPVFVSLRSPAPAKRDVDKWRVLKKGGGSPQETGRGPGTRVRRTGGPERGGGRGEREGRDGSRGHCSSSWVPEQRRQRSELCLLASVRSSSSEYCYDFIWAPDVANSLGLDVAWADSDHDRR